MGLVREVFASFESRLQYPIKFITRESRWPDASPTLQ